MSERRKAGQQMENHRLLGRLLIIALMMFGFGYAMIPLYKQICEATGINNVVKADARTSTQVDRNRTITVEFDANLRSNLPWRFKPESRRVTVHPGELVQVGYEMENTGHERIIGQAIPSYSPALATSYFKKLECFCFRQQTFMPGENRKMPVVFTIDPSIPEEVTNITLSYSFFAVGGTDGNQHAERT
ncbi:cytochrome c oxidase assembly protein [Burkholderiaceae bacterium DAT-1]|nr:cytochrome c oxidase assembly protein [Burkholderiaceae bacterium DAT-1]